MGARIFPCGRQEQKAGVEAMKWLAYIFLAALAFCLGRFTKPYSETGTEVRVDTVFSSSIFIRRDTVNHYLPIPILCRYSGDTIHVADTVLPVERKIYKDSDYIAYISGYRPQLDSISVCSKTITITNDIYHTVKRKPRRWGLGVTAGYGFGKDGLSPAVVVGVNYRIW